MTDYLHRCLQVMRCDDPALLDEWISRWTTLVDFQVVAVITSEAAAAAIA